MPHKTPYAPTAKPKPVGPRPPVRPPTNPEKPGMMKNLEERRRLLDQALGFMEKSQRGKKK